MSSEPRNEHELSLVMPFVVVKPDGPYDEKSFVAGMQCSQIMEALSHSGTSWSGYVMPGIVPQLDLIAMQRGLTVTQQPWEGHEADWTLVTIGYSLLERSDG